MKIYKLTAVILSAIIILTLCFNSVLAEKSSGWYIKRQGNKRPIFPPDSGSFCDYNAYFIDEKYPDESDEKRLYLTFDAGYENGNVEKILDILKEQNVPAAFFLLDNIILKNPDLVKRMADEGHLICNHTKRHKDLSLMTVEEIREDLSQLENICLEKTGIQMSKNFRFPEGKYSSYALKTVKDLGYKTFFWSFAYEDWDNSKQMSPDKAKKKILDNTHNGAIILLHPTGETNASILSEVIDEWRYMGYEFGRIDEIGK